jgi:hypothetical protein
MDILPAGTAEKTRTESQQHSQNQGFSHHGSVAAPK